MGISDTLQTTFFQLLRVLQLGYCIFPVLFGLFMILWGIFVNGWDWILIIVGLAIFLLFGRAAYQTIAENDL